MSKLKDLSWKIISSEYLFKRPWLTARKDVVQLPDGRVNNEFYVLEYPDWVNVIAITKEDKMVMIRQYRHGLRRTSYELVAGVIEDGEHPMDAAKRELLEESGYAGGQWQEFMQLCANPSTTNNISHTYLAVGVEKVANQKLDETEDVEVHIMEKETVRQMIYNNEFVQSLMAAPLLKYFSLYK
jgi:8-oxo-dGTP pyrophosphatase MutT (NUDIX family)